MAIEIVDLPINSMVMFHSYVSLPEGSGEKKRDLNIEMINEYTMESGEKEKMQVASLEHGLWNWQTQGAWEPASGGWVKTWDSGKTVKLWPSLRPFDPDLPASIANTQLMQDFPTINSPWPRLLLSERPLRSAMRLHTWLFGAECWLRISRVMRIDHEPGYRIYLIPIWLVVSSHPKKYVKSTRHHGLNPDGHL